MKGWKGNIFGSPSIGMFIFVTDEFCLIGKGVKERIKKELENTFGVKVYEITIGGTNLPGIFINGNDKKLIVPEFINKEEYEMLNEIADIKVLNTKYTPLGNNIIIGKNAILINKEMEENVKNEISEFFNLPIYDFNLKNCKAIGSLIVVKENRVFASNILKDKKIKELKKILKPEVLNVGTVNFGSPFIRSGLALNSYGFAVGSLTTGYELSIIEETFK